MTADDIRNVTFEQARKGYRAEDVDDFLQQVAMDIDQLEDEVQRLGEANRVLESEKQDFVAALQDAIAGKEDAESKMYILAEKVEEYRGQEDTLKTALINAQRMGETVVHEAKQKAEQMVREATGQSELIRQQAEEECARERQTLESLTAEVTKFKTTILNLYKQHIESLSALDPPVKHAEDYLKKEKEGEAEPDKAEDEPVLGTAEPELPDDVKIFPAEEDAPAKEEPKMVVSFIDDNKSEEKDPKTTV